MKAGTKARIGSNTVKVAHRDFADICELCGNYISRGNYYTKSCGEYRHWKCQQRANARKSILQDDAGAVRPLRPTDSARAALLRHANAGEGTRNVSSGQKAGDK